MKKKVDFFDKESLKKLLQEVVEESTIKEDSNQHFDTEEDINAKLNKLPINCS